jgi:hypothetical protein
MSPQTRSRAVRFARMGPISSSTDAQLDERRRFGRPNPVGTRLLMMATRNICAQFTQNSDYKVDTSVLM